MLRSNGKGKIFEHPEAKDIYYTEGIPIGLLLISIQKQKRLGCLGGSVR